MAGGGDKAALRAEFARRLRQKLTEQGMRPAELARRVGTGRHNISGYVNANALPRPLILDRIAKELGCEVLDLLPEAQIEDGSERAPAFEAIYAGEGMMRVRLDMRLPIDTVTKLMALLDLGAGRDEG